MSARGLFEWFKELRISYPTNPASGIFKNPGRTISILRLLFLWYRTYFSAQKKADVSKAKIVEIQIDELIPINNQAIYAYLFACIYVMYVAWYLIDRISPDQYRRAYDAYFSLIHEAEEIFLSCPTRMKDRERTSHPLTALMQKFDGPTNCYPSMHVALVTLSFQIIKDTAEVVDPLQISAMRKACIDICRSTMEIKQHSIIDVIGGMALTRKIYQEHFGREAENFLEEVLPELDRSNIALAKAAMSECDDLVILLDQLTEQMAPVTHHQFSKGA